MGFCRHVVHAESGCDSGVKGLPAATQTIGSLFNGGLIHTLATQSVTKGQDEFFPMDNAKFGFSAFAEQWNGRLAMMGFVIGLGTELLTGQGILSQVGLG